MVTRFQIRAARALLGWTQATLAEASSVPLPTLKAFELGRGGSHLTSTVNAIEAALERAGIIFLDPGEDKSGGLGVRLKE